MKIVQKTVFLFLTVSLLACNTSKKTTTDTTAIKAETPVASTGDAPGIISWEAASPRYSANGKFNKWKFTNVDMKKGNIETLNATIEVDLTSIWEKSEKLTDHLKAWDYFDVEKYQAATINIANIQPKGSNQYEADMTLAMRDQVQNLKSTFEVLPGRTIQVSGTAMIDRGLFGIGVDNKGVPNMIKVSYQTVIPTR